jgi:hypothetical protein
MRVEGEAVQPRQRGIAGPEIIKHQGHPARLQRLHGDLGMVGIAHHFGFGDFQLEHAGGQAAASICASNRVGEVRRAQLARRGVGREE